MYLRSAADRALSKTARNSHEQPGFLLFAEAHAVRKPRKSAAENRRMADISVQITARTASVGVLGRRRKPLVHLAMVRVSARYLTLFRHARESRHPGPAPGLNRGGQRRRWLPWTPAFEAVRKSAIWLDRHRASFETAVEPVLGPRGARTRGRPPQDEDFLNANKDLPHAEARPRGASRSTHYLTTAGLANLLTASFAGAARNGGWEPFVWSVALGNRGRGL